MSAAQASVERAGDALRFAGSLQRAAIAGLWKRLPALDGVRRLDLTAVSDIDSAGLALLAELARRSGGGVQVDGDPVGLQDLRSAYRMDAGLGFDAG